MFSFPRIGDAWRHFLAVNKSVCITDNNLSQGAYNQLSFFFALLHL